MGKGVRWDRMGELVEGVWGGMRVGLAVVGDGREGERRGGIGSGVEGR